MKLKGSLDFLGIPSPGPDLVSIGPPLKYTLSAKNNIGTYMKKSYEYNVLSFRSQLKKIAGGNSL